MTQLYRAFRHGKLVTVAEATRLSFYWLEEMERYVQTRSGAEVSAVCSYVHEYLERLQRRASRV